MKALVGMPAGGCEEGRRWGRGACVAEANRPKRADGGGLGAGDLKGGYPLDSPQMDDELRERRIEAETLQVLIVYTVRMAQAKEESHVSDEAGPGRRMRFGTL